MNKSLQSIKLKEVLYDGIQFMKDIFYIEIELKHILLRPKKENVIYNKENYTELTENVPVISKAKWVNYLVVVTITNFDSTDSYSEELELSSMIEHESAKESISMQGLSYGQLKRMAASFSRKKFNRNLNASMRKGVNMSMGKNSGTESRIISHKVITNISTSKEKHWHYSESLQKKMIARVFIDSEEKQVVIQVIEPIRGVISETPISFLQVSHDCLIPELLLKSKSPFLGKRIIDFYKFLIDSGQSNKE